jgi:DNA-binding GntR family transcriptional regulator
MDLVTHGGYQLIGDKNIDEGAVEYLQNNLGLRHAGYRDNIAVRPPDQHEAMFFNLPSDGSVPLVEILRTGFDQMGTPISLTVTVLPAVRNEFVVNVGEVPRQPSQHDGHHWLFDLRRKSGQYR